MVAPIYNHKGGKQQGPKSVLIFMIVLLVVILGVSLFFAFFKFGSESYYTNEEHFDETLSKVCSENPGSHSRLQYQGVDSFFHYMQQPRMESCDSWIKLRRHDQHKDSKMNETSVDLDLQDSPSSYWQYVCVQDEEKLQQNPCLVYSFHDHLQEHFEQHFQSLGCNLHVFPRKTSEKPTHKDMTGNVKDESRHPRDLSNPHLETVASDSHSRGQSLEDIVSSLGHLHQRISFVNLDANGREWPLLAQIVTLHDQANVQQISARIHLPLDIATLSPKEQHVYFSELHQVLEGLDCLGYTLIRSEPMNLGDSDRGFIEIGNKRYPRILQVNWMKLD